MNLEDIILILIAIYMFSTLMYYFIEFGPLSGFCSFYCRFTPCLAGYRDQCVKCLNECKLKGE